MRPFAAPPWCPFGRISARRPKHTQKPARLQPWCAQHEPLRSSAQQPRTPGRSFKQHRPLRPLHRLELHAVQLQSPRLRTQPGSQHGCIPAPPWCSKTAPQQAHPIHSIVACHRAPVALGDTLREPSCRRRVTRSTTIRRPRTSNIYPPRVSSSVRLQAGSPSDNRPPQTPRCRSGRTPRAEYSNSSSPVATASRSTRTPGGSQAY